MALSTKKQMISSAEVVDKHLILSLPNAIEPIIWRMSLDKIGTASFEIKPTKNNDAYRLVLKPQKGAAEVIAPFSTKEKALEALLNASDALQSPAVNNNSNTKKMKQNAPVNQSGELNNNNKKWLYLFIAAIVVIGLYYFMMAQIPKTVDNFGGNAVTGSPTNSAPSNSEAGVPLSADDFLNNM